jgi:hypothetical protein
METQRVDGEVASRGSGAVAGEQRVERVRVPEMRITRSRSVTGKVTEEEYARPGGARPSGEDQHQGTRRPASSAGTRGRRAGVAR